MLFGELVREADLGIQVVVAADRASARPVRSAVITDLPDPSSLLEADVVVLTTAMWSFRPGGSASFVDAVARSGASALVIGLGAVGAVPADVIVLCRTAGLTLATLEADLPLGAVAARIRAAQPHSAEATAQRSDALRARLAGATGLPEALAILADDSGVTGWVLSAAGQLLAWSGEAPSPETAGALWNALLSADDPAPAVHELRDREHRLLGHLVLAGEPEKWALAALLAVLVVEVSALADRDATASRAADELLAGIRSATASAGEVSARLQLLGVNPAAGLLVLAGTVADPDFPPAANVRLLRSALDRAGASAVGAVLDGAAVVIASGACDADDLLDFEHALPLIGRRQLHIGVSEAVVGVDELGAAVSTAMARMRAVTGEGAVCIADRSGALTHRQLLAQFAQPTRIQYAHAVLDPLVEYDSKNGGDLLSTLRLFLDNNGAWVETARTLELHPNTMRYRMGRVEDLTNRDLTRMADRVDLFLALVCLDL